MFGKDDDVWWDAGWMQVVEEEWQGQVEEYRQDRDRHDRRFDGDELPARGSMRGRVGQLDRRDRDGRRQRRGRSVVVVGVGPGR